ncbi:MAG: preprotein translocase subunit SecA, partial [Cytophagales bacterium]|nr:preprotein translocase subunit SecA [Armatimonadota bacterium]
MGFFQSLFDANERDIKRYRKIVDKINALEPQFEKLSDEELKNKTAEFRERVTAEVGDTEGLAPKDETERYNRALDAVLPEAFAACREAARRTLGMRHFDVQLIGGMVQHDGRISELKTGEGKTLMSTLGTYLNAIAGRGVHLVTANDYLVKRDAVWMGPLFHSLGLTVGILQGSSPETGDGGGTFLYDPTYDDPSADGLDARYKHARQTHNRREAYECDVTYGTSSEFGFDYLRDNMAPSQEMISQSRGHFFAIVDECDSNLIDEARTPLIISGTAERSSDLYQVMDRIIPQLERGETKKDKYDTETDEKDYTVDEKAKSATFTEQGMTKVEQALGVEDLSSLETLAELQHAVAALKAHAVFVKDRDYVVRPNREGKPEVVIVDEFTGRLMFGRRWSDGLHQAVEAKEGIEIENEQMTMATITIQNYFRLYKKLAGMTGTAKTEEEEFRKIYALDVVQVPTNKPVQRSDRADIIYKTEEAKLRGIITELVQLWCREQPVLVGTRSIEGSERVSSRLAFQALEVLGAIHLLRGKLEAERKSLGDKYAAMSQLLNSPLDNLTVPKLAPVAKELGVSLKMLDKGTVDTLSEIMNIEPGRPRERLYSALEHGIPHNILNAKYHEQEARIITEAGRKGAITIATNMAGRGVDILLGGTHYKGEESGGVIDLSYRRGGKQRGPMSIAHVVGKNDAAADPETLGPAGAGTISLNEEAEQPHDIAREREEVKKLGGLYILGTERHESRRIDNQLRGRAGRQGDPGASKFHVSLEDYLWRVFGDRSNSLLMRQWEEDQAVDTPLLSKMIERAQKKVEQFNFDSRKHVLEYDDVMNVQREVIYRERRKVLDGADLRETLNGYLHDAVDDSLGLYCPDSVPTEEWDRAGLYENLSSTFPLPNFASEEELSALGKTELRERLHAIADDAYAAKEEEFGSELMREIERHITLREIDRAWVDHLTNMDYLREGIGLRGYGQVDPLVAYKKEALLLFERMQAGIQGDVARNLFMAQVDLNQPQMPDDFFQQMQQFGPMTLLDGEDGAEPVYVDEDGNPVELPPGVTPILDVGQGALLAAAMAASEQKTTAVPKVGPNDPC